MENWLVVCLMLTLIWIFVVRNFPMAKGMALGFFAGLSMVYIYPLMPIMAETEVHLQKIGWLVILFPVLVFFLAYLYQLPMKVFILFGSAAVFTVCYGVVLQVALFRSVLMAILLNFLVFLAVFLVMFSFGWIIRGWRFFATALSDKIEEDMLSTRRERF
jgi:hypothetical protein